MTYTDFFSTDIKKYLLCFKNNCLDSLFSFVPWALEYDYLIKKIEWETKFNFF